MQDQDEIIDNINYIYQGDTSFLFPLYYTILCIYISIAIEQYD